MNRAYLSHGSLEGAPAQAVLGGVLFGLVLHLRKSQSLNCRNIAITPTTARPGQFVRSPAAVEKLVLANFAKNKIASGGPTIDLLGSQCAQD
jgi:hypothetical protein